MALRSEVGVDSLGCAEILAFLKDGYGVRIADGDCTPDNFRSINAILALVRARSEPVAA